MTKPLNKNVQFVKVKSGCAVAADIPYRVKTFGDKECVVIIDKKATTLSNDSIYQDMDCYKADQQVKLMQARR
jgi:hypothetical protein